MGETDIVQIRFKELANGKKSVYLSYRVNGKRHYEFPKLYILPEDGKDKRIITRRNKETMQVVKALQASRILELSENRVGITKFKRQKVLLLSYVESIKNRQDNVNTQRRYASLIKILQEYDSHDTYLGEIDKEYCVAFIRYLDKHKKVDGAYLTDSTKRIYYQSLKACLNYAIKDELIENNPCTLIGKENIPKNDTAERVYLDVAELQKLENTEANDYYTKQAFLFSCFTGLRWSDIEDLRWMDVARVTDSNGVLRYKVSRKMIKTKIGVSFYLSDEAMRWLPKKESATGKVFNRLADHMTVNNRLKGWVKNAGIDKKVTFHIARHTYATMLLTFGVDLYTVSKLLGHTNVQTTQIYAKIIDQKKEDAADQIDKFFRKKNATPDKEDVAHE